MDDVKWILENKELIMGFLGFAGTVVVYVVATYRRVILILGGSIETADEVTKIMVREGVVEPDDLDKVVHPKEVKDLVRRSIEKTKNPLVKLIVNRMVEKVENGAGANLGDVSGGAVKKMRLSRDRDKDRGQEDVEDDYYSHR